MLLTLRSGERAALGSLQRLLDDNGVPYSGPSASMVEQCADTGAMLDWVSPNFVGVIWGGLYRHGSHAGLSERWVECFRDLWVG